MSEENDSDDFVDELPADYQDEDVKPQTPTEEKKPVAEGESTEGTEGGESTEAAAGAEGQDDADKKAKKEVKYRRPLNQTALEAIFFVSGRPISVTRIAVEYGWEPKEVREMVRELAKKLKKIKAELQLLEVQRDRWVLQLPIDNYPAEFREITENILLDYPKKNVHDENIRKVLTHIAFYQPVSKAKLWKTISQDNPKDTETWLNIPELERVLSLLIQEGFVRLSGSPLQYKTTKAFYEEFGFDPVRQKMKQQLVRRLEKVKKKKK